MNWPMNWHNYKHNCRATAMGRQLPWACLMFFGLFHCVLLGIERAEAMQFQSITNIYGIGSVRELRSNILNRGNRRFELNNGQFDFLIKEDLRYSPSDGLKFIFRPYMESKYSKIDYKDSNETHYVSQSNGSLQEIFLEWTPGEAWQWDIGIQNYLWGPAESFSPSNPFFHFQSQSQSFFYLERGRALARTTFTWNDQINFMGLWEPVNNGETYWVSDREFVDKKAIKFDIHSATNKSDYMGFVYGEEELHYPFLGQYFNVSFENGCSVYTDFRETQGNSAYYPEVNSSAVLQMTEKEKASKKYSSLGLLGFRYEAENFDGRIEGIYNSNGLTKDEQSRALVSTSPQNAHSESNLDRLLHSGREFVGIYYSYWSLRFSNLGKRVRSSSLRYLHSHQDQSGVLQYSLDGAMGDQLEWYAQGEEACGSSNSELGGFERRSLTLGFKYTLN